MMKKGDKVDSNKKSAKKTGRKNKENILVFSAHSDDFVLGAGATIAKYTKEGKNVHCIVFSYGEQSHPWIKEEEVQKMRSKEGHDAAKVLGCTVEFFDLLELKFISGAKDKKVVDKLVKIVKKLKPQKIFTHSKDDPHPDHKAVNKLTLEMFEKLKKYERPGLFVFSVWNPIDLRTAYPALKVKVKNTFSKKVKALDQFPSQYFHIIYPRFMIYFRGINEGLKMGTLFAEKFYKIK
jgi:LmbE family N-acetylglucosaminyl deacetylase